MADPDLDTSGHEQMISAWGVARCECGWSALPSTSLRSGPRWSASPLPLGAASSRWPGSTGDDPRSLRGQGW